MKIVLSLTAILLVLLIETTDAIEESDNYYFVSPRDEFPQPTEVEDSMQTLDREEETRGGPEDLSGGWNDKRASEWKLRGGKRGPEWKLRGGKRGPEWKLRGGKRGPEWKLRGGKRWGESLPSSWSEPEDKKLMDWKLRVGKKRNFLGGKRVPGNWMLRGGKRAPVSWMLRGGKRSNGWSLEHDELNNDLKDYKLPSRGENLPVYYT